MNTPQTTFTSSPAGCNIDKTPEVTALLENLKTGLEVLKDSRYRLIQAANRISSTPCSPESQDGDSAKAVTVVEKLETLKRMLEIENGHLFELGRTLDQLV